MPNVFLSHQEKDKAFVIDVKNELRKSLMKAWLDKHEIPGGESLIEAISSGIHGCSHFVMFISNHYLQSSWCYEELNQVYQYFLKGKVAVIPVLLKPRKDLKIDSLPADKSVIFENLLSRISYIEVDEYNKEQGISKIIDSIWQNELIRFDPVEEKIIGDSKMQIISFRQKEKILPTNFLETWDFNIEDFLAQDKENRDEKPLLFQLPIAFNGPAPNWLYTAMTIPLKNKRTVFIFNARTSEYICAYSLEKDNMLGKSFSTK